LVAFPNFRDAFDFTHAVCEEPCWLELALEVHPHASISEALFILINIIRGGSFGLPQSANTRTGGYYYLLVSVRAAMSTANMHFLKAQTLKRSRISQNVMDNCFYVVIVCCICLLSARFHASDSFGCLFV